MQAMVIREFGPPEVMRLEEVPTPVPGPGEVLIEVHAVSVNRTLDLIVRAGKYPRPIDLPHVLGVDPSGIVVAVGEGVTTRKVGDRVTSYLRLDAGRAERPPVMLGLTVWGGYAEYVKLPARVDLSRSRRRRFRDRDGGRAPRAARLQHAARQGQGRGPANGCW